IDLNSINAKTVNYILPQASQEVALPASELTSGRNIKLQVPPLEILVATSEFGLHGSLAIEGVPLLMTAIEGILGGDRNLRKREIGPRGDGLWGWIKGAGCAVFATAAVPGYLLAAADLAPQFLDLAKLLRHELQHVKQYHKSSYNLVIFAHRYLFELSKAGVYSKNPLEIQAQEQEYGLNTDLALYSLNVQFFLIWRTFGLVGSLGYPVEEHNHRPDGIGSPIGSPILEKNFKNGVLQTRDREPDGTYCFRTFSAEEIWNRDATRTTPTINPV
ncbi:MAG: hypothetical protein Q9210_006472, partial [Variospora velana]